MLYISIGCCPGKKITRCFFIKEVKTSVFTPPEIVNEILLGRHTSQPLSKHRPLKKIPVLIPASQAAITRNGHVGWN